MKSKIRTGFHYMDLFHNPEFVVYANKKGTEEPADLASFF